jgi:hypothetical protein
MRTPRIRLRSAALSMADEGALRSRVDVMGTQSCRAVEVEVRAGHLRHHVQRHRSARGDGYARPAGTAVSATRYLSGWS